jgi:hypothetical protein
MLFFKVFFAWKYIKIIFLNFFFFIFQIKKKKKKKKGHSDSRDKKKNIKEYGNKIVFSSDV